MRPLLISSFLSAMNIPGPVAFSFSGYAVYWSGILLTAGVILTILFAQYEANRQKLPSDTAVDLCLIGIPLGVLGARLFYAFTNFSLFSGSFLRILYFWDGGLSVYGALIGVLIGILIYSLIKKLRFLALTDLLVPGLLLTQALALWGDFFEQRGFGPEIVSPALQWFPFAVLIERTDTIHAAVFFYEFVWCMLVFAALWFIVRRKATRSGAVSLWYMLLYPSGHIALTFLRQNGEYLFGGVRAERIFFVALIVIALVLLVLRKSKFAPQAETATPETSVTVDDSSGVSEDARTPEERNELSVNEPETDPSSGEETDKTEQPEPGTADSDGEPSGKEA